MTTFIDQNCPRSRISKSRREGSTANQSSQKARFAHGRWPPLSLQLILAGVPAARFAIFLAGAGRSASPLPFPSPLQRCVSEQGHHSQRRYPRMSHFDHMSADPEKNGTNFVSEKSADAGVVVRGVDSPEGTVHRRFPVRVRSACRVCRADICMRRRQPQGAPPSVRRLSRLGNALPASLRRETDRYAAILANRMIAIG